MKEIYLLPKIDKHTLKEYDIIYDDDDFDDVKGLYNPKNNSIFINLNAKEFNKLLSYGEDIFISALGRSIVHEYAHAIIDKYSGLTYSNSEEECCQLLSGQHLWLEPRGL